MEDRKRYKGDERDTFLCLPRLAIQEILIYEKIQNIKYI